MFRFALIVAFILLSGHALAQVPDNFEDWNDTVIARAHTAINTDYLSDDEKMVILYANLARADGPLFAQTFLAEYIRLKELRSTSYTQSLLAELKNIKNLPMLFPEKDLYNGAREHAIWSGKKGYEGHKGFKNRFEPLMHKYMEVGENIYYGKYTPIEIVIQLLIDEGISDQGHRVNLLNPDFNSIGVSIRPHKEYEYNCVMGFGKLPRTYHDYIER